MSKIVLEAVDRCAELIGGIATRRIGGEVSNAFRKRVHEFSASHGSGPIQSERALFDYNEEISASVLLRNHPLVSKVDIHPSKKGVVSDGYKLNFHVWTNCDYGKREGVTVNAPNWKKALEAAGCTVKSVNSPTGFDYLLLVNKEKIGIINFSTLTHGSLRGPVAVHIAVSPDYVHRLVDLLFSRNLAPQLFPKR